MDLKRLGERIRKAREAQGLSQEDLGALVSKPQKTISLYENGLRRLFAGDIEKIALALDVPITFLMADEVDLDEIDQLIVTEIKSLTTLEEKRALLEIVRAFCNFTRLKD